jgi:DNA modification methylase
LRLEYEAKRRFFEFPTGKTIGDVLHYSQESENYKKYGHLTVKPEKLTRLLITSTTRAGDLVFVPFSGSGTECAMAVREGRRCIGYDLNAEYVETGNARIEEEAKALKLFY